MVKRAVLVVVSAIIVVLAVSLILVYWSDLDYANKTKHETAAWAVITDSKDDIIAVDVFGYEVRNALMDLDVSKNEMWIGGIITEWDNYWGFRFDPETIVIAEITIEGAQSNIRAISEDLDYWMNTWQKQVYVLATVTEFHTGLQDLDF